MFTWAAAKIFLSGILKWLKDNPKFMVVVAILLGIWWLRWDAASQATTKCENKTVVQRIEVQKEAKDVRQKVRLDAARGIIPERLLRFYVD